MSKASLWVSAALCLAAYVFVYATGTADRPIRSDGFSYYVYLPAWFIFHDPTLREVARDCCGGEFPEFTAIIRWPGTRRWVNAHPIGVAVMQAPFFALAHLLTRWSNLSPDGFTFYYQHAAGVSGLFWTIVGLAILGRLLRQQFNDGVTAATLLALLLGTNLFHYATYDTSYSHPYSFALFAAFMYLTHRWHTSPSKSTALLIGIVAGLIVLVRHTNVLFLIVFALYGVTSRAALRDLILRLTSRWRELAVIALVAGMVVAPQLALYYQATGRVLVSSYGELGFNFGSPRLYGVLFSVQKGLFFWSPLLVLAVAGLALARGVARALLPGAVSFLLVNTYVIASWWDWQFGDSYGHRGFVESLPIFALGLATVFERAAARARWSGPVAVVVILAACLSLLQMVQYWTGVLPMSSTTWEQYRDAFLKLR